MESKQKQEEEGESQVLKSKAERAEGEALNPKHEIRNGRGRGKS